MPKASGDLRHRGRSAAKYCIRGGARYCFVMVMIDHSPVHSDPRVLGGTLVFRNTRVMAQTLLDYIGAGDSLDTFLEHFPTVDRQDAIEFLRLTREESYS